MDCTECRDNLSAFLEDELGESDQQSVEHHINHCPPCLAEYKSLDRTHQAVTEHISIQASAALWSRIEAQIKATARQPALIMEKKPPADSEPWFATIRNLFSWRVWAAAVATPCLALGLAYLVQQYRVTRQFNQAFQSYVLEQDQVEQQHLQQITDSDITKPDEYDNNPFILEDRHQLENPFKL